jgi:hypothetical protein
MKLTLYYSTPQGGQIIDSATLDLQVVKNAGVEDQEQDLENSIRKRYFV